MKLKSVYESGIDFHLKIKIKRGLYLYVHLTKKRLIYNC